MVWLFLLILIPDSNNDISIDKWTGELKLTSRDVIAKASNMTINVKISDSARPQPNSIQEEISIYFVDQTANELLSVIAYNIKVDKKAYVGTMVGNLNALVSSRREKFIYSFQKAPGNFPFYINSATGEIFVISQLNETNQVWFYPRFFFLIYSKVHRKI